MNALAAHAGILCLGGLLAWSIGGKSSGSFVTASLIPVEGYPVSLSIPVKEAAVEEEAVDQKAYFAADLLVESIVAIESAGNPNRVGSSGERGLMQIMPETWKETSLRHFDRNIPFDLAFDPVWNRRMGRRVLGDMQARLVKNREHWKHDLRPLLLACYNAGFDGVARADFDLNKLPASVRDYAARGSAMHDWYLAHNPDELRNLLGGSRGRDLAIR